MEDKRKKVLIKQQLDDHYKTQVLQIPVDVGLVMFTSSQHSSKLL